MKQSKKSKIEMHQWPPAEYVSAPPSKKLAEANKMIKLMEKKGTAPWLKK